MSVAVDWPVLFEQLRARGISLHEAEAATGIPAVTMRAYVEGVSHPAHWRGEVLIALWCRTLSKRRELVPTTAVYLAPRVERRMGSPS